MDTSRVDGVKAAKHRGTPRSHVRRLEVAVDDALRVEVGQRQGQFDDVEARSFFADLVVPPELREAATTIKVRQQIQSRLRLEG